MAIRKLKVLAATVLVLASFGAAQAQNIIKDNSVTTAIPGLTGFSTSGDQMTGLSVTAKFSDTFSQTLAWATTGVGSGGVTGADWGLSVSGDTFSADWVFDFLNTSHGQLTQLVLDASAPKQITVLDATAPSPGTPNSAQGRNFVFTGGTCVGCNANATYSNQVSVTPNAAVGDLYHTLTVDFLQGSGPRDDFRFLQDADNDIRKDTGFVPEPGSLLLIGIALAGLGLSRRHRRA